MSVTDSETSQRGMDEIVTVEDVRRFADEHGFPVEEIAARHNIDLDGGQDTTDKRSKVERYMDEGLTALDGVGGVRSYRLERDLGIETVSDVINSSVDELMTVWSIGPVTAGRIMGQCQAIDSELHPGDETFEGAGPSVSPDEAGNPDEVRVAIMFGSIDEDGSLPAGTDQAQLTQAISKALAMNNVEIRDTTRLGMFEANYRDDMGLYGGTLTQRWVDQQRGRGLFSDVRKFRVPFEKYSHMVPEWDARGPEPSLSAFPDRFDIASERDVEKWMPFAEAEMDIGSWADVVVIPVGGAYTHITKDRLEREGATVHVQYQLDRAGNLIPYEEPDTGAEFEPSPEETVSNRRYVVGCPECESRVYLDGEKSSSRCLSCHEDGLLTIVSQSSAGEVFGWEDTDQDTHVSDDPDVDELLSTDGIETGLVERDEDEWLDDKTKAEVVAGAGTGKKQDDYA